MQLIELLQQINQKIAYDLPHCFLDPLPNSTSVQRGECCKLYAVSEVMQWLYKTDKSHPVPPPVRGKQTLFEQQSLRRQAKELFQSQVGEMYDVASLVQLAASNGYDASLIYNDSANYCELIKSQITQGYAPIVFFDVDFETKGPGFHKSEHEHAAVIVGYFADTEKNLWFIATCWGLYYTYPADKLVRSAAQLAIQRNPETFYKIDGEWRSNQGRYRIHHTDDLTVRKGISPLDGNASFRNKIVVIKSTAAQINRSEFCKTHEDLQKQLQSYKPLRPAVPVSQTSEIAIAPDNYIALNEIITYCTLNLLQQKEQRYSPLHFEQLFSHSNIKPTVHHTIYQLFNAWIDDSVVEDIYNQNKFRSRSIVEEVSNSIDANPQEIHCTIRDGYYEVREKKGMGMSALTIGTCYLIPKESSKTNSDKQIGRFGIGSFTKLAHLNNADAKVIVTTKAKGSAGIRLEFRLFQDGIYAAISLDNSLEEEGTCTQVYSSEITQIEYQNMVAQHIDSTVKAPIFINGYRFVKKPTTKQASISINGICIQKSEQTNESFSSSVAWHFPSEATIAEGRDKIIVDSEKILEHIRHEIGKIHTMPEPDWALYANSIAPLVQELQNTNTSLCAEDNLMDFLLETVTQKLGITPCVLDTDLFRPLSTNAILRLHPLIIPKDWTLRIATLSQHWDSKGTQVWLADMAYGTESDYFIYDKDANRVFIDKTYYHQIEAQGKLNLLEFILSLPPHEIDAKYQPERDNSIKSSMSFPTVKFTPAISAHPYHNVYQQHGVLWHAGEAATKALLTSHETMPARLAKTKSLLSVFPVIGFKSKYSSKSEIEGKIATFRFANARFYFMSNEGVLFDEHFHPLFHAKWELLKAKMRLLLSEYSNFSATIFPDQEVVINADDVLSVYNQQSKQYELRDGLGTNLCPELNDKDLEIAECSAPYYLIKKGEYFHDIKTILYHKQRGCIVTLPSGTYTLLNNKWLAEKSQYHYIKLYDINTGKQLFSKAEKIWLADDFVLCKTFLSEYTLYRDSGDTLLKFEASSIGSILHFSCQIINDKTIHLSLMNEFGRIGFILATNKGKWHSKYYADCLGFPVLGIIEHQNQSDHIIHDLKTQQKYTWSQSQKRRITRVPGIDRAKEYCYQTGKIIPADTLNTGEFYLIQNKEGLFLTHNNAITPIKLSLQWDLNDVDWIIPKGDFFLINNSTIKNSNNYPLKALIDHKGKTIVQGYSVDVYHSRNDYFIECDEYIYRSNGSILINDLPGISDLVLIGTQELFIRSIFFGKEHQHRVYDLQGKTVTLDNPINFVSLRMEKGYFHYNSTKGSSVLYTPYMQALDADIYNRNRVSSLNKNKLIEITKYNSFNAWLFTESGYPYFNQALPEYSYTLLRPDILHIKGLHFLDIPAIVSLIPLDKLRLPQVTTNLDYLNTLSLEAFYYGLCLRFVEWPTEAFKAIVPHINLFTYTASKDLANDYQTIISICESFSKDARVFILKLFNLIHLITHEQACEPLAQKLICIIEMYGLNTLKEVYEVLKTHEYELRAHAADFSLCKPILDDISNVIGQLLYYLLYPKNRLVLENCTPIFTDSNTMHSLSLLDFMCALHCNRTVLSSLNSNPQEFVTTVENHAARADKSHLVRVLQHAIYHQADPSKHLYERELLQNALDSYAKINSAHNVIQAQVYEENEHCVFRLQDEGIGMSLDEVFSFYCLAGASMKRKDQHQNYIGGHGVGVFTAFHNAQCLRLKTGQNNGYFSEVLLRPIYSQNNRIIDIQISWQTKPGTFKGTVVERIARDTAVALDAGRHLRSFKAHARAVDANSTSIYLNSSLINHPYGVPQVTVANPLLLTFAPATPSVEVESVMPLGSVELPEYGMMKLFRSVEDVVVVSGLSLKPIGEMDAFIPDEIRKLVRRHGLIIDVPKTLALNRERTDFIDAPAVYEFLKPYLLTAYIQAYVHLFVSSKLSWSELPYDFFLYFEKYTQIIQRNNPELVQDLADILAHRPLKNYLKYQNPARLHELMAHVPLFAVVNDHDLKSYEVQLEKYSLVTLAEYYTKFKSLPKNIEVPMCITQFVKQFENQKSTIEWQKQCIFDLQNVPQVDWDGGKLSGEWLFLTNLSKHIAKLMGHKVKIGFSTQKNGSLMHTVQKSNVLYWNVYSISQSTGVVGDLFQALRNKTLRPSCRELLELYKVLSHELTHAILEDDHSLTHNRSFYIKQRKLLTEFSTRIAENQLIKDLESGYVHHCDQSNRELFDWKPFVTEQLLNTETLAQINTLLFNKKRKVEQLEEVPDLLNEARFK
ncbi:MAG: hypothetical protein WC627_08955 [Legionella sp.]|jgi:hypothetical protein